MASSVKFFQPQPNLLVQKSTKISEPNGNIILVTAKSSKSIMVEFPPKGVNPENTLNPKIHGKDKISISPQLIIAAFLLLIEKISIVQEIIFSKVVSTVESAAKLIKTKNIEPQNLPKGILLKILGKVLNIKLGPLSTSTP